MKKNSFALLSIFAALIFIAARPAEVPVSEISLERTQCYGRCPAYVVTFSADGEAYYEGKRYVDKLGGYKAKIDFAAFKKLSDLVAQNEFFLLKESYEASMTDMAMAYTRVVSGDKEKTVRNYGDAGPQRLREIETAIDEAADKLDWTPDEDYVEEEE